MEFSLHLFSASKSRSSFVSSLNRLGSCSLIICSVIKCQRSCFSPCKELPLRWNQFRGLLLRNLALFPDEAASLMCERMRPLPPHVRRGVFGEETDGSHTSLDVPITSR